MPDSVLRCWNQRSRRAFRRRSFVRTTVLHAGILCAFTCTQRTPARNKTYTHQFDVSMRCHVCMREGWGGGLGGGERERESPGVIRNWLRNTKPRPPCDLRMQTHVSLPPSLPLPLPLPFSLPLPHPLPLPFSHPVSQFILHGGGRDAPFDAEKKN
jgi:hypothetical protein